MSESVLKDKRLLAVDDEPDVLESLAEQLEDIEGLVLDTATDFETGYHLLRSWTYDLVILDIMGVRGFDLLNASVFLGFPSVMLTAHVLSVRALKKSIEMGARAYIPKEHMGDIVQFLEDVLTLDRQAGWKKVFERLGGFFNKQFGPQWRRDKSTFWDQVISGKYDSGPVILKK
jgi:DNA-binding response OmpR family regulator